MEIPDDLETSKLFSQRLANLEQVLVCVCQYVSVSVCGGMHVWVCDARVGVHVCIHMYVHLYSLISPPYTQDIAAQQKQLAAVDTVAEQLIDHDPEHSEDISERQVALANR